MADEELTLILRLRDEATKQMKSARGVITAAGAAIAAAGFTAGKKWDDATKTIVSGTGATGDALKGLQTDYQAVAKYGDGAATVIADLNTHLGLEGDALRMVAEAALKAKVDTNLFGDVASQLGLDAEGAAGFLDQLTVASQGTGVDIDVLTRTIGRSGARWLAAGGDMEGLTATVIQAADEFGPSGLRGAMSEILQEVDKGLIPSFESLDSQLGDTTGAVERTYEAGKTWRDTLRETKDAALAYLGPGGDMVGAIGSTASGLALAGPQMLKFMKATKVAALAQKAFNLVMRLNPIGLIITAITLVGLAIYKWRDQIFGFLKGAWNTLISGLETGYNFIARLVPGMEEVSFASKMSFEPAVDAAAVALEEEAAAAAAAALALATLEEEAAAAALALEKEAEASKLAAAAAAELAIEIAAQLEVRRLQKRQFFHDAVIARNEAKVEALRIEREEAIEVAVVLEARRLQKRQFIHDAVIARNELKVERLRIEQEEADAAVEISKASATEFLNGITSTFANAFAGGGGFMGGLQSVMTQGWGKLFVGEGETAAGGFLGKMQGVMGKLGGIPLVGPLLAAFGPALIGGIGKLAGKVWGAIKGLFGPSEAELAAREAFAGFHVGVSDELGKTERFAEEVQVAIAAGWDRTLAETRAGFILMGTDMGKTYDEAFADYERYEKAVKAGNTELMAQIEAEYAEWERISTETSDEIILDAAAIGDQFRNLTAKEALDLEQALAVLGPTAAEAFTHIHNGAINSANALGNEFLPRIRETITELNRIPRNITTTIALRTIETIETIKGRAGGGPVSAGSPYVVGERGPEIFVPSSSGSVAANKSLPTAEEIGAAVAAAMQRAPLVVPQDPVTDALYRNGPRRAALKGYA